MHRGEAGAVLVQLFKGEEDTWINYRSKIYSKFVQVHNTSTQLSVETGENGGSKSK